nr:CoA transferase [Nocardioides sp. IC4_145]
MPASLPFETIPPASPFSFRTRPGRSSRRSTARVVNLGALWAAPLAANLLGEAGFEVVHVESTNRPDASRWGDPRLHALLHAGAEHVEVDFDSGPGRRYLLDLVSSADVVIEASRPRALENLGVSFGTAAADGRARTWLQLTAHGTRQPLRVGFGDDAAVAGGLVAEDEDGAPCFSGDAVADPLTGLLGAVAVLALHDDRAMTHIEISLAGVASYCRAAGDPPWPANLPAPWAPRHRTLSDIKDHEKLPLKR